MTRPVGPGEEHHIPRLEIRVAKVLGAAEETESSTVFCPVRERSVPVSECERCTRFGGLHLDPTERRSSVVCQWTTPVAWNIPGAEHDERIGGPPDPLTPVSEIMTKTVLCVRRDLPIDELKALMVEQQVGGIPVLDEHGKPIGIVSLRDLVRADRDAGETDVVTRRPRAEDIGLERGYHIEQPGLLQAQDVMTPVVLSLHESANVGQAASLMAFEGVHRLPIVADDGQVVGILSSLDILRWFSLRSGYLMPRGAPHHHVREEEP